LRRARQGAGARGARRLHHRAALQAQGQPPGAAALAAAAKLRGEDGGEVVVDLGRYAQIAGAAK
jgi:hypothetical protein